MPINKRLENIIDCLYRVSAKGIIIRDGKVLLVQEKGDEWWSVPGGGIDYGETSLQALKRELQEELGIEEKNISVDDKIVRLSIGAIVDGIPRANLFYLVKLGNAQVHLTKHSKNFGWFTPEEVETLYLSPSTDGAKGLISLLKELV